MSSEEINVKNTSAAKKVSRQRKRFSGEFYNDISEWELSEKKRKKSEANKRYRERLKLKIPSAARAKAVAEYNRAYRERRKQQREAATATTTPFVSWQTIQAIEEEPESGQYEAEIQFIPQNAKNSQETNASEMNVTSKQEIQTDSDDRNAPLKRRKVSRTSSSEINFADLEEDEVSQEYSISGSDCISISDIAPSTEEFANMFSAEKAAEAARRNRQINKISKSIKTQPLTAAERSRAYRDRQKSLQNAAKIITRDFKLNFNEKEEVKNDANENGRQPKAAPKTPAQKSKEYRERNRSMILAAFEGITTREPKMEYFKETVTSDNNEDDKESTHSEPKKQLRYVLTLDERVAVIRQFDTEGDYRKIALNFNCNVDQIKSVVSNRKAVLEFHETTIALSQQTNEPGELRRRKLNLFGYCLYEYAQRAQYHFNTVVTEELILQRALEFRDLMGIDGFTPDQSWINQFMAAYSVNSSNSSINYTQRPRVSLDLNSIISHCVRHSAMASNLQPIIPETVKIDQVLNHAKTLRNTSGQNESTSIELESEDEDDSVIMKADYKDEIINPPRTPIIQELADKFQHSSLKIEKILDINQVLKNTSGQNEGTSIELESEDDDDSVVMNDDYKEDINSPRTPIIQKFQHSSLKIEKLHLTPLHIADYQVVGVEMPETTAAPSLCPSSEASDEAPLPRCVESFKDALRLLKPLEDFALMGENYRVIGLLSQLEQIFQAGKKAEERGSSAK